MDQLQIINLDPESWQLYKDLRLRALKEEPQAFLTSYGEAIKQPDSYWRERLEKAAIGNNQWLLFACLDGQLVGMIGAFAEKVMDEAHIIAVYVVPEKRGRGIAQSLMKELLIKIKANRQVKKVTVDVNPEQTAALNLYQNSGFAVTKKYCLVLGDAKEHDIYGLKMNIFK